jgi:hypothetical protein
MSFIYVLAGYEGSAHDSTVLGKAMALGFTIPAGCFLLGDAAYGISPWLLSPYRGVRYHLKEWATAFRAGQYVHLFCELYMHLYTLVGVCVAGSLDKLGVRPSLCVCNARRKKGRETTRNKQRKWEESEVQEKFGDG